MSINVNKSLYLYFSDKILVHSINAERLGANKHKIRPEEVSAFISAHDDVDKIYISNDVLLLNNQINSLTNDLSVSIFVSSFEIIDFGLQEFISNELKVDVKKEFTPSVICVPKNLLKEDVYSDANIIPNHIFHDNILLNTTSNVSKAAFTTKGRTLAFFSGLISASIDEGIVIKYSEWSSSSKDVVEKSIGLGYEKLIARSSALSEDSFIGSNAGAYESVSNVPGNDRGSIRSSISTVFESFNGLSYDDEVLLQKQLTAIKSSGVCTTRVLGKNSPYYVINYDDVSGRTDSVTSGDTNIIKTIYVNRVSDITNLNINNGLKMLLQVVRQLEVLVPGVAMDIEYVIDEYNNLNIVQVRPLVGNYSYASDSQINTRIELSRKLYAEYSVCNDGINLGAQNVFGVMPDANPAELIGIKPKPLAFSIYQKLITDNVVTEQRYEYGYRDVRPVRHMIKIGGTPFINVRSSFNSFTPSSIDDETANKLLLNYVEKLSNDTLLHDKVEFDIVATTWFPGIRDWFETNYGDKLNYKDIENAIDGFKGVLRRALKSTPTYYDQIDQYQYYFSDIVKSDLAPIHKAYSMINICHYYGCKPFAHLARSAFVAVSILKGLLNVGVLNKNQYDCYLQSIESISGEMEYEAALVRSGKIKKSDFYEKYGHLRPGTYDVTSEAYFENPEKYMDPYFCSEKCSEETSFKIDMHTQHEIEQYFLNEDLDVTFSEFDSFVRDAVSGREYGKFKYTKFLSYGLAYLVEWGKSINITRNDVSFLTIEDIHGLTDGKIPNDEIVVKNIIKGRVREYNLESSIELPDIICSAQDFDFFYKNADKPNFITGGSVSAPIKFVISSADVSEKELSGCIVAVDSADPGFDWLFGCNISGLITKYGGANSHMAIRCAELNIPAAIGVGNIHYDALMGLKNIQIDCLNEKIKEAS